MKRLAAGCALAALVASVALAPRRAAAGPCCMSSIAVGTGRLLPWEHFAVGARETATLHAGTWDEHGAWHGRTGRYAETELRTELFGLVSIVPRLSASLAVPAVVTFRRAGALRESGGGLGDVAAALRWDALPVGARAGVPGIALAASVLAPTGQSMEQADTALGAGATGRGAWVLGAGASAEHVVMPWFARLDLGATLPLPTHRADLGVDQRLGPGLSGALSAGREVARGLVASVWARLAWEADVTQGDHPVAGTSHADVGAGLALSFRLERWSVQASGDTGLFFDGLGRNQPGRASATLLGRYGQ